MKESSIAVINLASQPFRRERAQNLALALICVALVCSLGLLTTLFLHERAQAATLRRTLDREMTQLEQMHRQQAQITSFLTKPDNEDIFSTSTFLNELIARRAVSWTHVFTDLEKVIPPQMRVLSIRLPQIGSATASGADRVELDMVVGTQQPVSAIDLLKHLQASPLFGAPEMLSQRSPTQNDPLYRYQVRVNYAQKF